MSESATRNKGMDLTGGLGAQLHKKQNKLQGSSLFCSKGVLGLEINEVIRGITTNTL